MILYFSLGLCALVAAALVWRHDIYDHEPLKLLAAAVVLGAAAMWIAGRTEEWTFQTGHFANAYGIAAVAAFEEELLKVMSIIVVACVARREFNDPVDGIVYGSMAGLGMAIEESIQYLRFLPPGSPSLPPEELVRVCGHLVMGGIGGFAVGWAVLRRRLWRLALIGCFCAALILHFSWDWIVLSSQNGDVTSFSAWSGAGLMLVGITLYGSLSSMACERSRRLFAPKSPPRFWGWPFNRWNG